MPCKRALPYAGVFTAALLLGTPAPAADFYAGSDCTDRLGSASIGGSPPAGGDWQEVTGSLVAAAVPPVPGK